MRVSTGNRRKATKDIWSGFGDRGGDGPYVVTDPTWQIVDNLGWVRGKHSFRVGFEYNRQISTRLGNQLLARVNRRVFLLRLLFNRAHPGTLLFLAATRSLISCSAICKAQR